MQCETFDIARDDLIVLRLNVRKLSEVLIHLLGGRVEYRGSESNCDVHRLGRLSAKHAALPLHLCTRADEHSLIKTAISLGSPAVVMIPSIQRNAVDLDAIERNFKITIIAADEICFLQDDSIAVNPDAIDELRYRLGLGEDSPPNSFRMTGDHWEICFQKKRFAISDAIGMWYLAELLSRPGKTLNPVELENARTGIATRSSTSGSGDTFDEEARRAYKRTLAELGARIAEAERNDDIGTLEALQSEQHAILQQLQKDIGKNGKARVVTDESRSRKNVRQAVNRDIKRIAEHHSDLGEHLKIAFKGNAMCYRPTNDVNWEF